MDSHSHITSLFLKTVTDSHHPILLLCVSLLTNLNTTQYSAVEIFTVFSQCYFVFAVIHDPQLNNEFKWEPEQVATVRFCS